MLPGLPTTPSDIPRELAELQPLGWTALHDAMCLGLQRMKSAKNSRRALFVLTDGGDNNSRYSESEVKHMVVESDVRMYSVGLFERPRLLEKLAALTGGRAPWGHRPTNPPHALGRPRPGFPEPTQAGATSTQSPTRRKY